MSDRHPRTPRPVAFALAALLVSAPAAFAAPAAKDQGHPRQQGSQSQQHAKAAETNATTSHSIMALILELFQIDSGLGMDGNGSHFAVDSGLGMDGNGPH
jgi:hypothetical protein